MIFPKVKFQLKNSAFSPKLLTKLPQLADDFTYISTKKKQASGKSNEEEVVEGNKRKIELMLMTLATLLFRVYTSFHAHMPDSIIF